MKKLLRYADSLPLNKDKIFMDSDGNMRCPVVIAKAGVLEYTYLDDKDAEVKVLEAKRPEDLLNKKVIFSAEGKPVTREHPAEMVDSTNYFKYQKGAFINPRIVGDEIHGEIVIYDSVLQAEVKSGERYQISPGFWSSTEFTPGTLNGDRYDAAQKDIEINHIAIVKEGRAGDAVRVKLDSKEVQEMKIKMKNGRAVVTDAEGQTPEEKQRAIDAYEAARDAEGETPPPPPKKKEGEDAEGETPPPPPKKKEGEDAEQEETADEDGVDMESLPEPVKALIQQLMTENARLKGENADRQDSKQSFGSYLEARDFALKYVADKQLQPNHDSADYYKRAVVEATTGHSAASFKGAMLDSAYQVARGALVSIRKAKLDVYDSGHDEAQSELKTQREKAVKNNDAFSGKRVVQEGN